MVDYEFPSLDLGINNFSSSSNFDKSVNLPERSFPQQFKLKTSEYYCGGYYVCYNKKISPRDIQQACNDRDWEFLTDLIGDFFIIYADFLTKELFVFTGQSSAFPCYFSIDDKKLVLSPDFSLVFRKTASKTLDIGSGLDFIFGQNIGERTPDTFISEVHQLPPGNLLKINDDFLYTIQNLIDFDKVYGRKIEPYKQVDSFVDDLINLLSEIISEQVNSIGNKGFSSELSSGFDSGLVSYLLKKVSKQSFKCYSSLTPVTEKIDSKSTIEEFSKKHSLNTIYLDVTNLYPFSKRHDLNWTKNYFFPSDHGQEEVYQSLVRYRKDGAQAFFTGYGGDELYKIFSTKEIAKNALHYKFFNYVKSYRHKHANLFSDKARDLFLDRDRFNKKDFYLSVIPTTGTSVSLFYFPINWRLGLWQLTPFTDPRIVNLALRIPRKGKKAISRNDLFRKRGDIFLPSQFKTKIDAAPYVGQFMVRRKDKILEILKPSMLSEKGWVNTSDIIERIQSGNVNSFLENGNLIATLHNLIRLEYFIQNNSVKVSS